MVESERSMDRSAAALGFGADMIGLVIGGELTIVRRLAEGGMGAVFVVSQRSTGKERALKLMHREIAGDPDFQRRFEQEAKVGARIQSEHVVEVLAAGVDGPTGLPYLVMELLEGEDLRHRLARGPLTASETRAVFEQLSHAMSAAHAAGVVHRDLKPENVFLQRAHRAGAGPFTVKVLDFGIAKLVQESSTRATRGAVGSPLWMAPEQTTPGPVTAAADVWALGLVAYEMLVGKSFWRTANQEGGNTVQLLREIVLEPLPSATARAAEYGLAHRLPPGFDDWFARCVAREPAARFADAAALWRALPPSLASASVASADALADANAFAATYAAPSGSISVAPRTASDALAETGAATPFGGPPPPTRQAAAVSAAPLEAAPSEAPLPRPTSDVRPETPIATVHEAPAPPAPAPARRDLRVPVLGAIALVAVGVAIFSFARPRAAGVQVVTPVSATTVASSQPAPSSVVSSAPSTSLATAGGALSAVAENPIVAVAPSPSSARKQAAASASATAPSPLAPSAKPRAALPGGFSDPTDRNGAVTWKVQDRHVRLFVRLVSNESNVTDGVVRRAIEWSSWEYLRCYERAFGTSKEMPEGVVTVGFDILDQLPRHAKLVSSTIASDSFNDCVVRMLLGRTINAAGPDGKGHAVEAFKFVPN